MTLLSPCYHSWLLANVVLAPHVAFLRVKRRYGKVGTWPKVRLDLSRAEDTSLEVLESVSAILERKNCDENGLSKTSKPINQVQHVPVAGKHSQCLLLALHNLSVAAHFTSAPFYVVYCLEKANIETLCGLYNRKTQGKLSVS